MATQVKAKRPPKTLKEKEWLREYLENGGNQTAAALAVYDTENYWAAATIGKENVKKLQIDKYIKDFNLGPARYFAQMAKGLDATKRDQFSGEISEDHKTRADYHKRLGKILEIEKEDQAPVNNILVQPILGGELVQGNNGDQKVIEVKQEDKSNPGRDISVQDDIDTLIAD